ncbi:MAG: hypothetical protein WDM80_09460 [Limisphaerales bacterium]
MNEFEQMMKEMTNGLPTYEEALAQYNNAVWTERIFSFIFIALTVLIVSQILKWIQNRGKDLTELKTAVQQQNEILTAQLKPNNPLADDSHLKAKLQQKTKPNPTLTPPVAKAQSAHTDSSAAVHPDSKYMPKS